MQIGDLDRRVIIQDASRTGNNYGELELSWSNTTTLWAKIEWKGGGEVDENDRLTGISKVNFYIRNIGLAILKFNVK